MCILSYLPCSPMSMLTLRFYPEKPGQRKGLLQTPQRGLVASIHSIAEKAHSRKPRFIRPYIYRVSGSGQAGLINELPRRTLIGSPRINRYTMHTEEGNSTRAKKTNR